MPVLNQYKWHLSEEEIKEISIVFTFRQAQNSYKNYFELLMTIEHEEIKRKQTKISEICLKLQYSIPPKAPRNRPDELWIPSTKDSFELILDQLFAISEIF